jgi:hypothetical protein
MTDLQRGYDRYFPVRASVVLEEPWVLGIERAGTGLVFELEAMLTPEHGECQPPRPGEWACRRRSRLTVGSDQPITLVPSGRPATIDPDRAADYGNIDVFQVIGEEPGGELVWDLEGEWGRASVSDPKVDLRMCG